MADNRLALRRYWQPCQPWVPSALCKTLKADNQMTAHAYQRSLNIPLVVFVIEILFCRVL